jgi:hypothetical protein
MIDCEKPRRQPIEVPFFFSPPGDFEVPFFFPPDAQQNLAFFAPRTFGAGQFHET